MTCLPCGSWRNTCASVLMLASLSFCACSTTSTPPDKESLAAAREEKRQQKVSSEYEWAVQYYEAGDYKRAIPQLKRLAALGPDVPGYELVPFYLGMSLYREEDYGPATEQLRAFLQKRLDRRQNEEARIALLSIFERTGQWDRLLGLAAEMDKQTLFQDNRALLKLLWAEALWKKGETKSAETMLADALPYLDDQSGGAHSLDRDDDLWGRYHHLGLLLRERECRMSEARRVGKKRLYAPWIDAVVDCYRRAIDEAAQNLVRRESLWTSVSLQQLDQSLVAWGEKIRGYLSQESLNERRRLLDLSRQQIYRLMSSIEKTMKNFENQALAQQHFQPLRKRLELLLSSLAQPS